jgi:type I restriction enzyme S subunit
MKNIVPKGYKKTKVGIYPDDWKEIEVSKYVIDKKKFCNNDDIPLYSLTIEEGVVPKSQRYERSHLVKDNEDAYKYVEYGDFVYNPMNLRFGALAVHNEEKEVKVSAYYDVFGIKNDKVNLEYLYAYLKSERIMFYYNRMATGSLEEKKRVHYKEFKKFKFPMPSLKEQEKIAQILTTCDEAITKQEELLKEKEQLKKGLMRNLLSGEVRFKIFDEDWKFIKLGDLLDYEQPTQYLVSDTNYNDEYETPVLTAGKTFILGYTNETEGIFEDNLPVIIFDDFTTATQFVDFPFKAKSSAMKILKPKDKSVNVKLIYEIMQMINFVADDHKRYWISEYQELEIKLPSKEEQLKISEFLNTINDEINLLKNELEELKLQKKALMQKLLTGQVRVKA